MFNYVSLFSGAGGLDIGLERAGLSPVSLCEIHKVFHGTLVDNQGWEHCDGRSYFGKAKLINADIREVSYADLWHGGDLDLVVGGPPCQAFSSAGKQLGFSDPRGTLVKDFCRIVGALQPRMFLFENVVGLVSAKDEQGKPGGIFNVLLHMLADLGYGCRWKLLNSADYGSFQRRVRCFIVGSREGGVPVFPSSEFQRDGTFFEKPWRTLGEFLSSNSDQDSSNFIYPSKEMFSKLKDLPNGKGVRSRGKIEGSRPRSHWGYQQGAFIADLGLPARTVTGSSSQDFVRWNGELRRLTFNEVKSLQGFPEDWIVNGTKAERHKQVGNAVPTVFGEKLGRMIVDHLSKQG